MGKKRIGEILVDAGVVTGDVIELALREKGNEQKLGDYLVAKGYVKEITLYENLRNQLKIALVSLAENEFSNEVVNIGDSELFKRTVSFPVELSGSLLTVAMADPLDSFALAELEKELRYEISAVLGMKSEILDHIDKYFGMNATMEDVFNVTGIALSDKSEIQMVDAVTNFVVDNGKVNIVITENKSRTLLTRGNFFTEKSRELKSILKFVDQLVGLGEGNSKTSIIPVSDGLDVLFVVDTIVRGTATDHWISMSVINNNNSGIKNLMSKFEDIPIKGLVALQVPFFVGVEDVYRTLYDVYSTKNVISYGGNPSLSSYGIDVIDSRKLPIESVSFLSDVFLVDDIWTESGRKNAMSLLSNGKLVFIVVPCNSFDDVNDVMGTDGIGKTLVRQIRHVIDFSMS